MKERIEAKAQEYQDNNFCRMCKESALDMANFTLSELAKVGVEGRRYRLQNYFVGGLGSHIWQGPALKEHEEVNLIEALPALAKIEQ